MRNVAVGVEAEPETRASVPQRRERVEFLFGGGLEDLRVAEDVPGISFDPRPPQAGQATSEIVDGFFEAMTATPVSARVARQFLSREAAEAWVPEQQIITYSELGEATAGTSAQVPLTDSAGGQPYGILSVPGRDLGLQLLLDRRDDGVGQVLVLPYRVVGTDADGMPIPQNFAPVLLTNGETKVSDELGLSVGLAGFGEYTLLIAKADPGQGIVWLAFLSLIVGITITFWFPRRRIWARLAPDGRLGLVWRSDRYVDVEREFGRLLDDLVAVRRPEVAARPEAPPAG